MSFEHLAAAAIAVVGPYLPLVAKGAATEAGKQIVAAARPVYDWLRAQVVDTPAAAALDNAVANPESADRQTVLKVALEDFLAANPTLADELRPLVAHAGQTIGAGNQTAIGDNNVLAQTAGIGNKVSVSRG